jgi:hypothetical protein
MSHEVDVAPAQTGTSLDPPPDKGRGKLGATSFVLIGIGVIAAAAGIALLRIFQPAAGIDRGIYTFLVCVGFAIILSEIGTRAAIRSNLFNAGVAVTGSGVVAIGLYVLLYPGVLCELGLREGACPATRAEVELKGTLRGNFSADRVRAIMMRAPQGEPILGAFDFSGGNLLGPYLFEIKESQLVEGFDTCIKVSILEDQNTVLYVPIIKVRERIGEGKPLVWQFDRDQAAIVDNSGPQALAVGSVFCANALPVDRPAEPADSGSLIGAPKRDFAGLADILAPPASAQGRASPLSSGEVQDILKQLDFSKVPLEQEVLRQQIEIGSLSTISALGEWLAEAPDDSNRQRQVALALPELLRAEGAAAKFAAIPDTSRRAIAGLLYSDLSDISDSISAVLISYADENWVAPVLEAYAAHPDTANQGVSLVLRALYDKADDAGRADIAATIRNDPRLSGTAELKGLVAGTAAPATDTLGWSFYGVLVGDSWQERYFDADGNDPAATPNAGDVLTAKAQVNIRAGPIEYQPKVGWVNQRSLDVAKPGDRFAVVQKIEVIRGFVWVELAAAN